MTDGIYDIIRVHVRVEKFNRHSVDIAIDNDHDESGIVIRGRLREGQSAEYRIPLKNFNMTHKERAGLLLDRVLVPVVDKVGEFTP